MRRNIAAHIFLAASLLIAVTLGHTRANSIEIVARPSNRVPIHSQLDIDCKWTGKPDSTIIWRFNYSRIAENQQPYEADKYAISIDGQKYTLTILDVDLKNEGRYSCGTPGAKNFKQLYISVFTPWSLDSIMKIHSIRTHTRTHTRTRIQNAAVKRIIKRVNLSKASQVGSGTRNDPLHLFKVKSVTFKCSSTCSFPRPTGVIWKLGNQSAIKVYPTQNTAYSECFNRRGKVNAHRGYFMKTVSCDGDDLAGRRGLMWISCRKSLADGPDGAVAGGGGDGNSRSVNVEPRIYFICPGVQKLSSRFIIGSSGMPTMSGGAHQNSIGNIQFASLGGGVAGNRPVMQIARQKNQTIKGRGTKIDPYDLRAGHKLRLVRETSCGMPTSHISSANLMWNFDNQTHCIQIKSSKQTNLNCTEKTGSEQFSKNVFLLEVSCHNLNLFGRERISAQFIDKSSASSNIKSGTCLSTLNPDYYKISHVYILCPGPKQPILTKGEMISLVVALLLAIMMFIVIGVSLKWSFQRTKKKSMDQEMLENYASKLYSTVSKPPSNTFRAEAFPLAHLNSDLSQLQQQNSTANQPLLENVLQMPANFEGAASFIPSSMPVAHEIDQKKSASFVENRNASYNSYLNTANDPPLLHYSMSNPGPTNMNDAPISPSENGTVANKSEVML